MTTVCIYAYLIQRCALSPGSDLYCDRVSDARSARMSSSSSSGNTSSALLRDRPGVATYHTMPEESTTKLAFSPPYTKSLPNGDTSTRQNSDSIQDAEDIIDHHLERRLRLKVDLRLCTIAGILCSLNLLDSGIISSASVTSMLSDLDLTGHRYSVSIFIFTISSIAFQLPSTIAVRTFGPRIWFAVITFMFGLIKMCTAFIHTWREMIALRVLLGGVDVFNQHLVSEERAAGKVRLLAEWTGDYLGNGGYCELGSQSS